MLNQVNKVQESFYRRNISQKGRVRDRVVYSDPLAAKSWITGSCAYYT